MDINRRFAIVLHDFAAPAVEPASTLEGASWHLLRMPLLIFENDSIRQTSFHARVDDATVRSRIDQLQSIIGVPLLAATAPNQVALTKEALWLVVST